MGSVLQRIRRIILPERESGVRISIISPSDLETDLFRQLQWGDYWAKYELTKSLGQMGYTVTNQKPNIIIHFFGHPVKLPRAAFKIIWVYSHPEKVTAEVLRQYDRIFCLSSSFALKIKRMGFECDVLYGATAKKKFYANDYKYDVFFVGNNRLNGVRDIVRDVSDTAYNFKVWGNGWEDKIAGRYIGGKYIDYTQLNEYYARSRISLNDHSELMRKEGFVAVRVFDILASGGFCISDKNQGIEELFGDAVPQYETSDHLKELFSFYLNNEDARQEKMRAGRAVAEQHTWRGVAQQIVNCLPEPMRVNDLLDTKADERISK